MERIEKTHGGTMHTIGSKPHKTGRFQIGLPAP
jgi:hypothetical protein